MMLIFNKLGPNFFKNILPQKDKEGEAFGLQISNCRYNSRYSALCTCRTYWQ